jgi:hypothetical protein
MVGYVTTPPGQEEAAVSTFVSELSRLSPDGLSEDELDRGRRYLAGMLEISMQRGAVRAASYSVAEVAGMGYEYVDTGHRLTHYCLRSCPLPDSIRS